MNSISSIVLLVACAALASGQNITWRLPMIQVSSNGSTGGISGQIVGGAACAVPHQASLFLTKTTGTFLCGASLIHPQWVLTAAHCTTGASSVTVRLGSTSWSSGGIAYSVGTANIFTNTAYNPVNLNNDVALIKLPVAIIPSVTIKVIPLVIGSPIANTVLSISGWGKTCSATGCVVSPTLQCVNVYSIDNTVCAATYGTSVIVPSTICTKGTTIQSTCQGDSGGPLYTTGATPKLVGVTSFVASLGCDKGYPAGYARASSFCTWIKIQIPSLIC